MQFLEGSKDEKEVTKKKQHRAYGVEKETLNRHERECSIPSRAYETGIPERKKTWGSLRTVRMKKEEE